MACVVAGGWSKRGRGVPLRERLDAAGSLWPARHCLVEGGADASRVPRPGLLLEWRRTSAGWEGRVAYAALLRPGAWTLVEEWLPGELLTPVALPGAGEPSREGRG